MKVQQILDKIISYAHNEDTPDTDLNAKALEWLNAAYFELLQENLAFLSNNMQKQIKLPLVNGVAELPDDFYIFLKAKLDESNVISKDDISDYTIENGEFVINQITFQDFITFKYIPEFTELTVDTQIADLPISSSYIQGLIWGALVFSSVYERGINTQTELKLFESKWNQAKQNYKISLAAYSDSMLRTKPYSFFNLD